ncbi:MAG: EAL domain-containing protein, partial [Wenzhouxiangellaceae bacterium]|nr:EAL domain-containing protein [Wenzhouxiangellaceae bacterium]
AGADLAPLLEPLAGAVAATSRNARVDSNGHEVLSIDRPKWLDGLDEWVLPVREVIQGSDGRPMGTMVAALRLEGDRSFFEPQSFLGPRNNVQIVRDADLVPIHWAAEMPRPDGLFTRSIPRAFYDDAIESAERRTGMGRERIKASATPVPYRVNNALGPHVGMALFEPRYDYWVISQTHRDQLLIEFARVAAVYLAVFVALLLAVWSVLRGITRAERRAKQRLVHQAHHDTLTGLPNRQRLGEDFEEMRNAHRDGFALLFIDMDNFKTVNDGFGHAQGDGVLGQIGSRLRHLLEPGERVARVGGDEFVVLTPETGAEELMERAGQFIERLAEPYVVNGIPCELGCSIGIARWPEAGTSLSDGLRSADVAMYAAKRERNAARFYEPAMGRKYLENIRVEQRLRGAIDREEIDVVYQPQVDAQRRVIGIEALARWNDAELGPVKPRRFIAVAEASGMIEELGDHIVQRCLRDAAELRASLKRPLRLSINISVRQLLKPGFSRRMIGMIETARLDGVHLVLEITESLFMEDLNWIVEELESLRLSNIGIALDDFGTGFSSLSLLRSLPIDELKIDKSFVDNLERDEAARKLVQSVVAIAKNHGMSVVAEGVETERQFELLREDGCDAFQGYLFFHPLRASALESVLARAR